MTTLKCKQCGRRFEGSANFCSLRCQERFRRVDAKHKRRELEWTGSRQIPSKLELFAKQGGECAICRRQMDLSVKWPSPVFASYDHIQALSAGGRHEAENLQLAHIRCNQSKFRKGKKHTEVQHGPLLPPLENITAADRSAAEAWDLMMASRRQYVN